MSEDSDQAFVFHRGLLSKPDCENCPLKGERIIAPEGNPHAKVALVGEAPGYHEVLQGAMFVGPSGHFLDRILQRAEVTRGELWLTNTVLCKPKTVTVGDKLLNPEQVMKQAATHCRSRLIEELRIVKPAVVVGLGSQAVRSVYDPKASLKGRRGGVHVMSLDTVLDNIKTGNE